MELVVPSEHEREEIVVYQITHRCPVTGEPIREFFAPGKQVADYCMKFHDRRTAYFFTPHYIESSEQGVVDLLNKIQHSRPVMDEKDMEIPF